MHRSRPRPRGLRSPPSPSEARGRRRRGAVPGRPPAPLPAQRSRPPPWAPSRGRMTPSPAPPSPRRRTRSRGGTPIAVEVLEHRPRGRGPVLASNAVGKYAAGFLAIDHPVAVEIRFVESLTQFVLREGLQAQRAKKLVAREVELFLRRGLVDRGEASTGSAAAWPASRYESRRFSSSVDCGETSRRRPGGRGGAGGAPRKRPQHDQLCCGSLAFCKVCSRREATPCRERGNLS